MNTHEQSCVFVYVVHEVFSKKHLCGFRYFSSFQPNFFPEELFLKRALS
ncbi:hypothetical protein HMPREF0091_11010 [Fannyhessea vaginae DSM 15829]|uniref:Uncharacterized protein n=1 Tax=Fannyhessea vaginae DSM 15829 TaxID=525256 RepID=F1T6B0_9ACTN|nr:hypothetical protein HMPREF0091_11010 [Fannyhessea vaginae DSM 15829]